MSRNVIKTDSIVLNTTQKKRYFYSAEYFMQGTAKSIIKKSQDQQSNILKGFNIKRLDDDGSEDKKKLSLKVALLVGGIWVAAEVIKKATDIFPYKLVQEIPQNMENGKQKIKQFVSKMYSEINLEDKVKTAVNPMIQRLRTVIDYMGLVFDYAPSYEKYGSKLTDKKQKEGGIFGDLMQITFQTMIWYTMQRIIPNVILRFWNLPLSSRLDVDKGIVDVLFDDSTGYFHTIGDPYKRRLDSITQANESLNFTQDVSITGKDFEELVNMGDGSFTGWLSQVYYISNLEDYETDEKTINYFKAMAKQVGEELNVIDEQIKKGTFNFLDYSNLVKDKDGNLLGFDLQHTKSSQRGDPFVLGLTKTAEMPYSKLKKGIWTEKSGDFQRINELIYAADKIVTNFTHSSSNPKEQKFIDDVRRYWQNYGVGGLTPMKDVYHYRVSDVFSLVRFMPYLVMLETYAAKNSIQPMLGILDGYIIDNSLQKNIDDTEEGLKRYTEYVDEHLNDYRSGRISAKEYINNKHEEIENLIKDEHNYNKRTEQLVRLMEGKALKGTGSAEMINLVQRICDNKLKLMFNMTHDAFASNMSSTFNSFNSKNPDDIQDAAAHLEGKQLDYKIDEEYKQDVFFSEDVGQSKKTELIPKQFSEEPSVGSKEVVNGKTYIITSVEKHVTSITRTTGGQINSSTRTDTYEYYSCEGEVALGNKRKIRARTIREDGSIWLEEFYEYDFFNKTANKNIYKLVGSPAVRDTSSVSSMFGKGVSSDITTANLSTVEKANISVGQLQNLEDLISEERKKRAKLFMKLAKSLEGKGMLILLKPLLNTLNDRLGDLGE